MPDAGRQGGRPQSGRRLLVTFAPQRQPCLHVERRSASERARRHRDESANDEGRGSTRYRRPDWSSRGDSGKPNHTPKAYHHAQRRLGAARDMGDPWLDVRRMLRSPPNGYNTPCYTSGDAYLLISYGRVHAAYFAANCSAASRGPATHRRRMGAGTRTGTHHRHSPSFARPSFHGTLLSRCRSG
jgi:hypothetical protein